MVSVMVMVIVMVIVMAEQPKRSGWNGVSATRALTGGHRLVPEVDSAFDEVMILIINGDRNGDCDGDCDGRATKEVRLVPGVHHQGPHWRSPSCTRGGLCL